MTVTNSRKMRWARHIECMREMRNLSNILAGNPERKGEHLETLASVGR
jgi:hypothetical protein